MIGGMFQQRTIKLTRVLTDEELQMVRDDPQYFAEVSPRWIIECLLETLEAARGHEQEGTPVDTATA